MKPGVSPDGSKAIVLEGVDEINTAYAAAEFFYEHETRQMHIEAGKPGEQSRFNSVIIASFLFAWLRLAKAELEGRPAVEFVGFGRRSNILTLDKTGSDPHFSLQRSGQKVECRIGDPEGEILRILRFVSGLHTDPDVTTALRAMLVGHDAPPSS